MPSSKKKHKKKRTKKKWFEKVALRSETNIKWAIVREKKRVKKLKAKHMRKNPLHEGKSTPMLRHQTPALCEQLPEVRNPANVFTQEQTEEHFGGISLARHIY